MKNYAEAYKFALENPVPETVESFKVWLEQVDHLISEVAQPSPAEEAVQPEIKPEQKKLPPLVIYTDGACSGNPGKGGWGAVLSIGSHQKQISGFDPMTTNNKMELTAAIKALEAIKKPCNVEMYSDSSYVVNNFARIDTWERANWKAASGKSVANRELWEQLKKLSVEKCVTFKLEKVAGHAGVELNELCDKLATDAIKRGC